MRRRVGVGLALALLVGFLALQLADRAGAGVDRCAMHRDQAAERSETITGSGHHVAVIGDSWSVGLGLDDLEESWPRELDGTVHVAGFSGSGFSASASPCGRSVSFAPRAARGVTSGADVVVVEGGLNDADQPDAAITTGFRRLMHTLAGQRVVVVGPATAPRRAAYVPRVDALLRELSAAHAVPYISSTELELPYLEDGLHLTADGHAEFGRFVAHRMTQVSPARPLID